MTVIFLILFLIAVLCAWVILYDTHRFVVVRYRFSSPKLKKSLRLVMLSDLHNVQYGRDNEQLLKAIEAQLPDCVVLAGDMITAKKHEKYDRTLDLLRRLSDQYPVYYAYGNHEQKLLCNRERFGDLGERFEKELGKTKVRPLHNLHSVLKENNVALYGLEIGQEFFKRFEKKPMPEGYLEQLLGSPDSSAYCVLLAHNPDYFLEYAAWGAELVLSGHVHGGIVRLPGLGGVISPAMRFFPKYDGGLFEEGKSHMVLGRGIGTHSPNVRMFNPAELVVVELVPEKDSPAERE